jgi:penicillin-binding protein 2
VLPSKEWKAERFKRNRAAQKWVGGDTISISIGQGFNNYTMLQLAHATAILANDGVVMKPHLVKMVEDGVTRERTLTVPKETRRLSMKQEHLDFIKDAMAGVMREGTGQRAFSSATYTSAGKTGTAQVIGLRGKKYDANAIDERHRDNALFTAFAPVEQPRIALAMIVENAGFGGVVAAPIARKVLDYAILGKRPAPPPEAPSGPQRGARPATVKAAAPAAAPLPSAPATVTRTE